MVLVIFLHLPFPRSPCNALSYPPFTGTIGVWLRDPPFERSQREEEKHHCQENSLRLQTHSINMAPIMIPSHDEDIDVVGGVDPAPMSRTHKYRKFMKTLVGTKAKSTDQQLPGWAQGFDGQCSASRGRNNHQAGKGWRPGTDTTSFAEATPSTDTQSRQPGSGRRSVPGWIHGLCVRSWTVHVRGWSGFRNAAHVTFGLKVQWNPATEHQRHVVTKPGFTFEIRRTLATTPDAIPVRHQLLHPSRGNPKLKVRFGGLFELNLHWKNFLRLWCFLW